MWHYYLNPRANYKTLNEFYKNSKLYEFWNNRIFPATEKVRSKKIFKPRVKKILQICKKYKVNRQKIIDIGAGYGTFCSIIKETNFFKEVIALEPNVDGAKKCIEKKIKTLNLPIEKLKKININKVSVFTLFVVIENLYSTYKFLKKINKFTNKKTLIIFTCPNGMGLILVFRKKK